MSGCIRAREVVIALRANRRGERRVVRLVCPARWTKTDLLRYVRGEHPSDSVRIVEWLPAGSPGDPWEQRLWLANPSGFRDYPRALEALSTHDQEAK